MSLGKVSPAHFEKVIAMEKDSFSRLTPQQYYTCAEKFVGLLKLGRVPPTISDSSLPPEVLHEIGCILRFLSKYTGLSVPLWACASNMGFVPSTISLAMQLVRGGTFGKHKAFQMIEARFKKLVIEGKDPNAMTVDGQLLFTQTRFTLAAAMLAKALRVGSSDFELKPSCQLYLAKTYLKLGRDVVAMDLFDQLAKIGVTEAHAELGRWLMTTDPNRARQHLYEAARGQPELYKDLFTISMKEAASASGKRNEDLLRWALEWWRLADRRVEF
ncbi:hypothetical protein XA68_14361 [Ophiocordyceps unilateralis]|uniref:Uncharacterized protein n=1 Tax=Ophiocordyceps unilateralis TaxID=268505 RepID=A0A2A9PAT7_OPHUN|nr:hypothetical protein XA68_14361 [Ophiocordyceps unilateralis]